MRRVKQSTRARLTVEAPPSKAHTLRALFLAALAEGRSVIHKPLMGEDQQRAMDCLQRLGVGITAEDGQLTVRGVRGEFSPKANELNVGESGVSMNFLTALSRLSTRPVTITASGVTHRDH